MEANQFSRIPRNLDDDGFKVMAGDSITFCFGIPPVRVVARVERFNGRLYAMTPDHNPKRCELGTLRKYVGLFWKVNP